MALACQNIRERHGVARGMSRREQFFGAGAARRALGASGPGYGNRARRAACQREAALTVDEVAFPDRACLTDRFTCHPRILLLPSVISCRGSSSSIPLAP